MNYKAKQRTVKLRNKKKELLINSLVCNYLAETDALSLRCYGQNNGFNDSNFAAHLAYEYYEGSDVSIIKGFNKKHLIINKQSASDIKEIIDFCLTREIPKCTNFFSEVMLEELKKIDISEFNVTHENLNYDIQPDMKHLLKYLPLKEAKEVYKIKNSLEGNVKSFLSKLIV